MMNYTAMALSSLFDKYDPATDYDLTTVVEFQALPPALQPMYTVADQAKHDALTLQTSTEPFVELQASAREHGVTLKYLTGITEYGSVEGKLYLRQSAAQRLCQAGQHLAVLSQGQHQLLLTDAYRPLALQRQHYEKIKSILKQQGYTGATLYKYTTQLIADPDLLPPHTTGGTVDLTLWDVSQQQPAWLGTPVDAIDTKHIHTWHKDVAPQQRQLRVLLYHVMTEAGFINHPLEWWHYSYGDTEWAIHSGQSYTLYQPVEVLPAT